MTARTGNAFVPTTEATRWIVYFAYLGEEGTDHDLAARRLSFMEAQLRWLADLIRAADRPIEVLVPYVAPRSWDGEIHRAVSRHGFRIDPASVQADRRNTFEYHGFRAMQTLAEAVPAGDLVFYCHSKGIVHLERAKTGLFRLHTHVALSADLRAGSRPRAHPGGAVPLSVRMVLVQFLLGQGGLHGGPGGGGVRRPLAF